MSTDINETIRRTLSAIAGAEGAKTRLTKLPVTPQRREWLKALEHVIGELETELRALRYAARHPKAAA